MASSVLFVSLLCSFMVVYVTACDRCLHQSKAAYFSSEAPLSYGACGYGSLAPGFLNGNLAGAVSSFYKNGAACGACIQIRCKDTKLCSENWTKVIVFDLNTNNEIDLVLSSKAFRAMANPGFDNELIRLGISDVEYRRVPCKYKQNLAVRVEERSQKPYYLAVKFLYQGGQTEIVGVDIAQAGSGNWVNMSRNFGAVWDTNQVPDGPLQFRWIVTSGYEQKYVFAKNVVPEDWRTGQVYDSGVQIDYIAHEECFPCDDSPLHGSDTS